MNRKLSLVVVIVLLAFLALTLSASGVIAREVASPDGAMARPQASQCAADSQVARLRVLGQVFDEQGMAREGLRVQAVGPDDVRRGETRTQADGRYKLIIRSISEKQRPRRKAQRATM